MLTWRIGIQWARILKKLSFTPFLYHLSFYTFNIFFVKFFKMCQDKCFEVFPTCLCCYFGIAGISCCLWIYTHWVNRPFWREEMTGQKGTERKGVWEVGTPYHNCTLGKRYDGKWGKRPTPVMKRTPWVDRVLRHLDKITNQKGTLPPTHTHRCRINTLRILCLSPGKQACVSSNQHLTHDSPARDVPRWNPSNFFCVHSARTFITPWPMA